MKAITQYFLLLFFLFSAISCETEEEPFISENDELFIGFWEYSAYTDTTQVYLRTKDLSKDKTAFAILSDGTFLENKNSGWCGTPPISYAQYVGTWLQTDGDTLLIDTQFWGGEMQYYLIIVSASKEKLEVKNENIYMEGFD